MEQDFRIAYKPPAVPVMEKSHIHRELELTMILSDRVRCRIGGAEHLLQKNTLVLFNNFERHCVTAQGGYRRYVCLFLPAFVGGGEGEDLLACFFVRPQPDANILPLSPAAAARLRALFDRAEELYLLPESTYARRLELQLLLKVLLAEVNRLHRERCGLFVWEQGPYTRISQVLDHIQTHLAENDLSLDTLARRFAVSRTQLAVDFKAVTGTTVRQYIIDCRIWHAAALLEQGASAEQAGAAAGYLSPAHFSRSFKARVGQSPKRYALAHRAKNEGE